MVVCRGAAVLPQSGLAVSSDAGIWKIDPAKSNVSSGAATLVISRSEGAFDETRHLAAVQERVRATEATGSAA